MFHGLVNYGTQAGFLAQGLRAEGIDALSVCYHDKFKRKVDTELLHGGGFLIKVCKHFINSICRVFWFFRYNTFHFYYGTTLFPRQWDLPLYRFFGKKVVMEYLGNDVQGYQVSVSKYKWTNINHFIPADQAEAYDRANHKRLRYETEFVDKQLVYAPVNSEFVSGSEVLPLAIDTLDFPFSKMVLSSPIKIMHAPTHRAFKGTDFILDALERLIQEGEPIEIMLVEGVTHEQLKKKYAECHLFIDQIMGGWYGTASIEAMSIGRPVICSIRKEYFQYIDYGEKIPIIHADPDNIYEAIKKLLRDPSSLKALGLKSRQFVEEVHELKKVTKRLIQIYNNL